MDSASSPLSLALFPHAYVYTTRMSLSLLSSLVSATISAWRDYLFHWVSVTLYGSWSCSPSLLPSLSLSFFLLPSRSLLRREMKVREMGSVVSSNKHRWFTTVALNHSLKRESSSRSFPPDEISSRLGISLGIPFEVSWGGKKKKEFCSACSRNSTR